MEFLYFLFSLSYLSIIGMFAIGFIATGYYLGRYTGEHNEEMNGFILITVWIVGLFMWLLPFLIGYNKRKDNK